MIAWYLRRAVPWTALLGCLALAVGLTALVHRWEVLAGLALPLVCLLAVSGAAFAFDEPCTAVATVKIEFSLETFQIIRSITASRRPGKTRAKGTP